MIKKRTPSDKDLKKGMFKFVESYHKDLKIETEKEWYERIPYYYRYLIYMICGFVFGYLSYFIW